MEYLKKAIGLENIPNLLLYGNDIDTIDIQLKDLLNNRFTISIQKNITEKEINFIYNNIYYEFNMITIQKMNNFIELLNTLIISKNYYFELPFKIIILNQFNNLKIGLQNILRVTFEKYRSTTIFIIVTNKYSNIIEPLKSRCLNLRFPSLKDKEKREIIYKNINLKNTTVNLFNNIYKLNNNQSIIEYLNLKQDIKYRSPTEIIVDGLIKLCNCGEYSKLIHNKMRELIYKLLKFNLDINKFYYHLCSKIINENLLDKHITEIIRILNDSYYNYIRSYRKIIILECLFINIFKFYNLKLMNIVNQ